MATNYASLIYGNPPSNPEAPIVVDADRPDRSYSWKQYASMTKRVAVGLRALGVQEQDTVGLLSDNDIYYHVLGDATLFSGATFVTVPPFGKQAEIGSAITVGGVNWLFVAPKYLEITLATFKELGKDDSRLAMFDPPDLEAYTGPRQAFSRLFSTNEDDWKLPSCFANPEQVIAQRSFTSGTTGVPKAAEISQATLTKRASLMMHSKVPKNEAAPKLFDNVALFHPTGHTYFQRAVMGLSVLYLSTVSQPTEIIDLVQSNGCTEMFVHPRGMDLIVSAIKSGERSADTLKNVKEVMSGGSSSRLDTLEAMKSFLHPDARLISNYGSTEVGFAAGAVSFPECSPPFTGKIIPTVEIKIIDPSTLATLPNDTDGEICVRSGFIFSGYRDNAKATEESFLDDPDGKGRWFRTGDKGFLSGTTGLLAIVGRFKEVFKVPYQGMIEEVAPAELETELHGLPDVTDAAVIPVKARDNDEALEPLAYLVKKPGSTLTAQQVIEYIDSRMARHKVPVGGVLFVEAMPRNYFGKLMRGKLDEAKVLDGSARYLTLAA